MDSLRQTRRSSNRRRRVETALTTLPHFLGAQSENENVLLPDMVADLYVRAVERSDGQRTIQRELHIPCSGCFHSCRRDLLRKIGRRNNQFGKAYTVIWNK